MGKVLFLYPNLKQIHFLNLYKFDDEALRRLIAAIQRKDCKLGSIKFVYTAYEGSVNDCQHFYDPDSLDNKLMKKLKEMKRKDLRSRSRGETSNTNTHSRHCDLHFDFIFL